MARYIDDDVQTALAKRHPVRAARRYGTDFGQLNGELTSRISSADIAGTLDQMGVSFDPAFDSNGGKAAGPAAWRRRARRARSGARPYDVVLATSMLQVGVDVPGSG